MQSKKIPHVGDPAAPDNVEMTTETKWYKLTERAREGERVGV